MSSPEVRTLTRRQGGKVVHLTETTITLKDGTKETKWEEDEHDSSDLESDNESLENEDEDEDTDDEDEDNDDEETGDSVDKNDDAKKGGKRRKKKKAAAVDVPLDEFRKQALTAHNEYRKIHHSPNLVLSDDLNDYAQNWAEHLAKNNLFQHSKGRLNGKYIGENIAAKWTSGHADYTGDQPVRSWYNEVKKYNFDKESNKGTGHFTQVVWKNTSELGMGKAHSADGKKVIAVGSYRTAGNWKGNYGKNVFPA